MNCAFSKFCFLDLFTLLLFQLDKLTHLSLQQRMVLNMGYPPTLYQEKHIYDFVSMLKNKQFSEICTDTNRFIFHICQHTCAFVNAVGIPVMNHLLRLMQNSYLYFQMLSSIQMPKSNMSTIFYTAGIYIHCVFSRCLN